MPKKLNSSQSFLQGALILMLGTLIVKVVSLLFKIPITNMLSEAAMSYFENAYTFFTLFSTLATAGFPVAISKIVAEYTAKGRFKDNRKLLSRCLILFLFTGLFFSFCMFLGADLFAALINNPGAELSIRVLSPAVFCLCLMSAFRGYYQGLQNMIPTAVSQIIESVVKMICGVAFTYLAVNYCKNEFDLYGTVLGKFYASQAAADVVIYQVGSAGALFGVVISTAAGCIFLFLRHKLVGDGFSREMLALSPQPIPTKPMISSVLSLSIPICLGSLVLNLSSMVDMVTVLGRLNHIMEVSPDSVRAMYGNAIPSAMYNSLVPAHLYGAYTSIAVTISNIVPSATTGFGISALPVVSAAWAKRSRREVGRSINSVLRITALFAVPAGVGIMMMAAPICRLFFFNKPMGVAIAVPILQVLGLASIFISLTTTLNSLLQAVGRVSVPVRLVVIGAVVKFALNFILVGIPSINLKAVGYATLICYFIMTCLAVYVLSEVTHIKLSLFHLLFKPFIAALLCGFTAALSFDFISSKWESSLAVIPAIALGACVYFVAVIFLGAVRKDDILMLPKGEKIAKILEKWSLIS